MFLVGQADYNNGKQLSYCTLDYISATTNDTYLKFNPSECPNEHWDQRKEYFKITVEEEDESEVCVYFKNSLIIHRQKQSRL